MVFIVYSAVFKLLGLTRNLFVHLLDLTRLKVNLARPVENVEFELVPPQFIFSLYYYLLVRYYTCHSQI